MLATVCHWSTREPRVTLSLCPGLVCVAPSGQVHGRLAAGLILRGPLSLLSAANAGPSRRTRSATASCSGSRCLVLFRHPRHLRDLRFHLRGEHSTAPPMIDEPHHAAWRPPSVRHRYRSRTLGSADAYSRSAGAILLAGSSSACLGRTLRKYDAASSGCPCPHPRRYPCHDPCRSPVRQRTRIGIRIGTRIGTAHWRRCRPFLPSSSCRGQRSGFAVAYSPSAAAACYIRVIILPRPLFALLPNPGFGPTPPSASANQPMLLSPRAVGKLWLAQVQLRPPQPTVR